MRHPNRVSYVLSEMMKRCVFKLMMLLLSGAVVNVAVAWACVLGNEPVLHSVQWQEQIGEPHTTNLVTLRPPGRTALSVWRAIGVEERRYHRMFEIPERVTCGNIPELEIPKWLESVIHDGGIVENANDQRAVLLANCLCQTKEELLYGAPCRALSLRCLRPELSSGKYADAFFLDDLKGDALEEQFQRYGWYSSDRPLVFPLRPLWSGLAINTIFYAAILWMLFALPFAIRRIVGGWRIKRGLCVKCAYPVGTNERCTECGAALLRPHGKGKG